MKQILRILLPFVFITLILVLFLPKKARFGYEYSQGRPWAHENLFAEFDFPILKRGDRMDQEKYGKDIIPVPYFRLQPQLASANLHKAADLNLGSLRQTVLDVLQNLYAHGIVSDENESLISGPNASEVVFIQREKRAQKSPSREILSCRMAQERLLAAVPVSRRGKNVDSLLRASGVFGLIEPNLVYDSRTTELMNSEGHLDVSPTQGYVKAGELIVSNGEIVTDEIAQMLDSYRKEYEATLGHNAPRALLWLGDFIMAAGLVTFLFFAIYFTKPLILKDVRLYYILLIYLLFALAPLLVARFREDLLYLIPFPLAALFLHAFFRPRVIFSVYITTLLPLLVFTDNGMILFTMNLVAGAVAIFAFFYFNKGWKQFLAAFVVFLVLSLIYMGFQWLGFAHASVPRILLYLLVSSLMMVFLYPMIYLFEKIFNLVSDNRLIELSATSNALIMELEQKAPGTFQHSMQVANMAEKVARAIHANPHLVRAAALYHDIGKMSNPQCFIENESLVQKEEQDKYHHGLSPEQSAAEIIRHVPEGYEMARKRGLPGKICEFILTHHGDSVMSFFYNKYLDEGGDPSEIEKFRYPGKRPSSREQVILMLCDTVEAASRTLNDHGPESFSRFVDGIVSAKLREDQLDDSDITIRELGIIKDELKEYLAHLYHGRIAYPKKNNDKIK